MLHLRAHKAQPLLRPRSQHRRGGTRRWRVLLVEDDADAREVTVTGLEKAGFELRAAGTAQEALTLLDNWVPDVIVSDIGMPGVDGYEFMRLLRARPPDRGGRVAALALTAFARLEDAIRARSSGYQGHLAKPISPEDLATAIAKLQREGGFDTRGLKRRHRSGGRRPHFGSGRDCSIDGAAAGSPDAMRRPCSICYAARPKMATEPSTDSTVATTSELASSGAPAIWRRYLELTKPKVVALITFTAIVGTLLASPGMPPLDALIWGNLGIALASGCAATINHVLDRRIDEQMNRTRARPLPTGQLNERQALVFAAVLGMTAMAILSFLVNLLTAVLTFCSLIGYAVIYTVWLKRATSQNIVIGGAAGAAPPVLGWAAVTNTIDPNALLLFLIIFVWTPPHFWALAIARRDEYARAGIPMLPVTHGVEYTRLQVLLYTVLLVIVTLMPFLTHMSGLLYLVVALGLNAGFLYYAFALKITARQELPMKVFKFSVNYLMWLFAALLADHYFRT